MRGLGAFGLVATLLAGCSLFLGEGDFSGGTSAVSEAGAETAPVDSAGPQDASLPTIDAGEPTRFLVWGGGAETTDQGDVATGKVLLARIAPNGEIGAWTPGPSVPNEQLRVASVAAFGERLFALAQERLFVATMSYGELSAFRLAGTLPNLTSAAVGGGLYVRGGELLIVAENASVIVRATITTEGLGGFREETISGTSEAYAPIGIHDGEVFALAESSAYHVGLGEPASRRLQLLGPLLGPASSAFERIPLLAVGSFLYQVGRVGGGDAHVYVAPILGATLGTWRETEPYTTPRGEYSVATGGSFLYVLGGRKASVSFTRARADGELAPWKETGTIPVVVRGGQNAAVLTSD